MGMEDNKLNDNDLENVSGGWVILRENFQNYELYDDNRNMIGVFPTYEAAEYYAAQHSCPMPYNGSGNGGENGAIAPR